MRNGLNIAAMSELISEVRENDIEAHLFYKVSSCLNPDAPDDIRVLSLEAGSARVARYFSIAMGDKYRKSESPSYMDYALGALGSCVLITFVFGCSAKGIIFNSIDAKISITSQNGELSLGYSICIDCDGSTEDIVDISNMVSRFSPNHRTFQDENCIDFHITGSDGEELFTVDKSTIELTPYVELKVKDSEARLSWLHGTQYLMKLKSNNWQDFLFKVDQPKQYIGYDYGPNPQEILLASILQEVKENLLLSTEGNIQVNGHVNIKGILGVDSTVEPKMDRVKISIVDKNISILDIKSCLKEALAKSVLIPIFINQNKIVVSVCRNDSVINSYISPQKKADQM